MSVFDHIDIQIREHISLKRHPRFYYKFIRCSWFVSSESKGKIGANVKLVNDPTGSGTEFPFFLQFLIFF
ncbi:hypothetical protein KM043_007214 [Ampulex compressa]|nr:hypothetical protein KM043_007214 [Ampulex compressa]